MELNGNTELQEIKIESPKSGDSGVAGWSHDSRENSTTITIPVNSSSHNNNLSKKPQDVERKWRHFPGKNKFFCNGRLMTAPNISFCVCCFLLIVVTFFLFIIFDGPYLAKKWSIAVPILGVILFLIVITNMLKTTFSDPGIIPRASQQEVEHTERLYASNQPGRPPPRTKDENVNGQILKMKYCFTCKMFRPPRASHCGVCDNCVDRFDHHCPFLGNCIGKRNYPNFYGFVLSLSFLTVFVLSCAVAHLVLISKENEGNFLEALKESPTSAVVIIISFFGVWTVLGLAGFHTYLVSVEQTTNEDIKGVFGRSAVKNPFSRGNIFRNCSFVLCGPLQPSLIDPRGLVTEDFLISLPKKLEVKGVLPSSVCNPNNFQTSMKTGPHCVENGARPALTSQFQRPTMTPQSLSMVHLPRSQDDDVQTSTEIGDGIKISRHSPDSGNGLLYTSASSSKSIGEVNSESLRNLYTAVEDEQDHPTPRSPDSGSECNISERNKTIFGSINDDDFDDPTLLHSTPKPSSGGLPSSNKFSYEEIDLDDPVSVHVMQRINSTSNAKSKRAATSLDNSELKKKAHSSSGRNRFGSEGSASSIPKRGETTTSYSGKNRTTRNPIPLNSNGVLLKSSGEESNSNNALKYKSNGKASTSAISSSSLASSSSNSRASTKKLGNSTMINSPLHLDPVT